MRRDELLERVAKRAALSGAEDAERVVEVVLGSLGQALAWKDVEALRGELTPELEALLERQAQSQPVPLDGLQAQLSATLGVPRAVAIELTLVVCRTVATLLREPALYRLRQALPDELSALFCPFEPRPEAPVHLDATRHTLAEGHGGGDRPLYSARPDTAHSQSIARADNPHGETKLSGAQGLTQEREEESLASGKPGSSRPLHGE